MEPSVSISVLAAGGNEKEGQEHVAWKRRYTGLLNHLINTQTLLLFECFFLKSNIQPLGQLLDNYKLYSLTNKLSESD
jgi:hypothetical protein